MSNLIIQTAFIGDLLLAIPLMKKLKQMYPRHHQVLLCRKGLGSIFVKLGLVDEVFEIDKENKSNNKDLLPTLKKIQFENIYCPHQSFRTHWILSQLKANKKVGFKKWWNKLFYDQVVSRPMHLPDALRQLSLLINEDEDLKNKFASVDHIYRNSESKHLIQQSAPIPEWASMSVRENLLALDSVPSNYTTSKPIVFIAPGSVWPTKRWKPEGFREVAKSLLSQGYEVCLIGTKAEREICNEVAKGLDVQNKCGETSLFETLVLLAHGQGIITNDSGAQHLAAAVELPIVSIFGPTTLELGYRPWHSQVRVVEVDLSCRPCGIHGGKKCPIGTHDCMQKLSAQQVLEAFASLT